MAELKKRRDLNRPLEFEEVDGNWDELDRRTKTERELDTIDKIAQHIEEMPDPGAQGETPTLQEVVEAGNSVEVMGVFGVEGVLSIQTYRFSPASLKRGPSLIITEQGNIDNSTVFTGEGVVYHDSSSQKRIAFPFGVQRSGRFSGETMLYFPLSINGKFADEFGAVMIPETIIIPITNGNVEIGEVFGFRFLRDSKIVGFEIFCDEAPTGGDINVNLLINDSYVDTAYISDSETLSSESWMENNPLEVYRGDKISFEVASVGTDYPGTNLQAVLKCIEIAENDGGTSGPSTGPCEIDNFFSVYNDGGSWVICPGFPNTAILFPSVDFGFDLELKFDDNTSEVVHFNRFAWGSQALVKDLTGMTIIDAVIHQGDTLFLHGVDDNGNGPVEKIIVLDQDIHANNISNENRPGVPYERISFLINTTCEIY